MFYDARMTDLHVPAGKYYFADTGFPICDALLIPKRGVWYHLAEWGRAQQRCRFFYSMSFQVAVSDLVTVTDLPMQMSSSIYDMHQLATSLSVYLES